LKILFLTINTVTLNSGFIIELYAFYTIESKAKVKNMKPTQQNRKNLKIKITQALDGEINCLPMHLQSILIDDLITAFESRFSVLNKAKLNLEFVANVGMELPNETLKA